MVIRQEIEQREYEMLSCRAAKSAESKGRACDETSCMFRTDFQRDRDRIIHSKAFRRLIHKTQVFLAPEEDHYRTRLTHTLEVAQISRTVARILAYNEDLTEAIALGHDLGHTPFGHKGEKVLNAIHPGGFSHNIQSLRTVDCLEETSRRTGLNLTFEVRDGIRNHSGKDIPVTLEGQIVRICDRIAYVNHDIDDAVRSGVITLKDLPAEPIRILGTAHSDRINSLITDLCRHSEGRDSVELSPEYSSALLTLRAYMFQNVYDSPKVLEKINLNQVEEIITSLYRYYLEHPDEIQGVYRTVAERDGVNEAVKDWISGMTDRFALNLYRTLFE